MDALLYRPWWEEEDFAKKLGLPVRPVRQILRLLETVSQSLSRLSHSCRATITVKKAAALQISCCF